MRPSTPDARGKQERIHHIVHIDERQRQRAVSNNNPAAKHSKAASRRARFDSGAEDYAGANHADRQTPLAGRKTSPFARLRVGLRVSAAQFGVRLERPLLGHRGGVADGVLQKLSADIDTRSTMVA